MKKLRAKRHARDILFSIGLRKSRTKAGQNFKSSTRRQRFRSARKHRRGRIARPRPSWEKLNIWFDSKCRDVLDVDVNSNRGVTVILPSRMNFSSDYEITALCLGAIRKLVKQKPIPSVAYRLRLVDFSKLESISSSAALVLTAELSRWEDSIMGKLKPFENTWNDEIFNSFYQIGFFDLFECQPIRVPDESVPSKVKFAKYLKGKTEKALSRKLRDSVQSMVGDTIDKWMFLRHGLDEAITNVTQHAYPDDSEIPDRHKNWYMTGSYTESTNELKIVFYDQGIGIPKSLPAWDLYEKALMHLSKLGFNGLMNDEYLIKASMETTRSRTRQSDRGKGLIDMLDFVEQRDNGYISVLSGKGLYKFSLNEGTKSVKSVGFKNEVLGTIIIWCVILN